MLNGTHANRFLELLQAASPKASERIRKLATLEPGWDGYGGEPPTEQAIETTARLLIAVYSLTHGKLDSPFIAPSPDGGLDLEWELDSGTELMLVIPPTGTEVRYLLDKTTSSGDTLESEGILAEDGALNALVSQLTC